MNENKIVDKTADKTNWPIPARELWLRIAAHSFEDPGDALTFTNRLARDHGWTLDYARKAILEYRRFCFLAMMSPEQVTPSEEVDEVWHQHLTYSRDYWQGWCGQVLCRPLHHQPTKGGANEGARFAAQYAGTLALYETWFGPPDPAFWPGTASRFGGRPRFVIVDRKRAFVIRLPRLAWLIGGLWVSMAVTLTPKPAAAGLGIFDWPADAFLTPYTFMAVLAVAGMLGYQLLLRFMASREEPAPREFTPVELALMASGEERAVDVLALDLLQSGQVKVVGDKIEVPPRSAIAEPSLADVLRRHGSEFTRPRLVEILSPDLRPSWDGLAREGWALSAEQVASIRRVALLLVGSVALIGLAKIGIGFWRGKPVGLLIVLTLLMVVVSPVGTRKSLASLAGILRLRDYREENARALRAPQPDEVIAAFAVVGAVALEGTHLQAYAELLPKRDGGDGGGGSGCGGCGD